MPKPKAKKIVKTKRQASKPEVSKPKASVIYATLKLLGKTCASEGKTIDEVLDGLKDAGGWMKGAGVLTIEKDGVVREKIIAGNHIRNLFGMASGTMRQISLKWVKSLFS